MAKTTINFDVTTGAEEDVRPTSIAIRPTTRLTLKTGVVLPAPTSVLLENGAGTRTIESSPRDGSWAWEFQEFAPGYTGDPTARFVPESDSPVNYQDLMALSSPPDQGFGPAFAGIAQEAAARAEHAVVEVEGIIQGLPFTVQVIANQQVANAVATTPSIVAGAIAALNTYAAANSIATMFDSGVTNDDHYVALGDGDGNPSQIGFRKSDGAASDVMMNMLRDRGLVGWALFNLADYDDDELAVGDADGVRSWLRANAKGLPSIGAKWAMVNAIGFYCGYDKPLVFPGNTVTWLDLNIPRFKKLEG